MISNIFLDIFFFEQIANINLFRLLKLISLFLLYIFLNNCIYFSRSHILLDFLWQLIENTFMLYSYSQQRLFKFIVGETYSVVLVVLFIFCKMPKDFS